MEEDQADRQYLCWIFRLSCAVFATLVCVRCAKVGRELADWKERLG